MSILLLLMVDNSEICVCVLVIIVIFLKYE